MTTEGSFDPRWRGAILGADRAVMLSRLGDLLMWARSRLDHIDRELAGRDLTNPTRAALVHMTERVALIAVLDQLSALDREEDVE